MDEIPASPLPMTPLEREAVSRLTPDETAAIDRALVAETRAYWRKVAMVIAGAMEASPQAADIPDSYFASRVQALVSAGTLELQGNPDHIRFSEVRRNDASGSPK